MSWGQSREVQMPAFTVCSIFLIGMQMHFNWVQDAPWIFWLSVSIIEKRRKVGITSMPRAFNLSVMTAEGFCLPKRKNQHRQMCVHSCCDVLPLHASPWAEKYINNRTARTFPLFMSLFKPAREHLVLKGHFLWKNLLQLQRLKKRCYSSHLPQIDVMLQ